MCEPLVPLPPSLPPSPSHSLNLQHSDCVCLFVRLPACLSVCQPVCLPSPPLSLTQCVSSPLHCRLCVSSPLHCRLCACQRTSVQLFVPLSTCGNISPIYTSALNRFQSGFKSVQGSCVNAPNALETTFCKPHNGCGLAKPV